MDTRERKKILVTCGPGLKDLLQNELTSMGFEILNTHPGGVTTKGSFVD